VHALVNHLVNENAWAVELFAGRTSPTSVPASTATSS
jgi:hypothetical protein